MGTLEEIKEIMANANITLVSASYSGAGDSGQIDNTEAYTGEDFDNEYRGPEVGELEDLIYDLIAEYHPGYEINEGGFGEVTLKLANQILRLEFSRTDYVPETETIERTA